MWKEIINKEKELRSFEKAQKLGYTFWKGKPVESEIFELELEIEALRNIVDPIPKPVKFA